MRKIITLCLFVFALFLGTQTTVAQNTKLEAKKEINAVASTKAKALKQHIKFDKNQQNGIYEALKTYGQGMASLEGKPTSEEEVAKIEKQLDDKVKSILNDEQYQLYKAYNLEN